MLRWGDSRSGCRGRGFVQILDFKRDVVNTGLRFVADEGVTRWEERQNSRADAEHGHRAMGVANGTVGTPQPEVAGEGGSCRLHV